MVTSLTGLAASNFNGSQQGAQARIDVQNAAGGVNGRQIVMDTADDTSSPTGAGTAAGTLITEKNVFAILAMSDVFTGAYKTAHNAGLPVVGAAVDGPEWGQQPYTNMFSVLGNEGPTGIVTSLELPNIMKFAGATNVASIGNGNEPASAFAAKQFTAAAQADGLKVGYQNYTVPLGSVDMTAVALQMKSLGIDGFYAPTIEPTIFALLSDLQSEGLKEKAAIVATGYGQDIFADPTAVRAGQGALYTTFQTPVEEKTPATLAEQAAFAKYEHFTGIPNLNWTWGWESADLFIKGLQAAGQNPTRAGYIAALHGIGSYDAEGLAANPIDISLAGFGHFAPTSCTYVSTLNGNAFVPLNNGKPICGKNLPSS
jgi:branched-chain amino acid transport system substrate-binding protein